MSYIYVVTNSGTPIKAFEVESDAIDFTVEDIVKYNSGYTKEELYEEMSETGSIGPYDICDVLLVEAQ